MRKSVHTFKWHNALDTRKTDRMERLSAVRFESLAITVQHLLCTRHTGKNPLQRRQRSQTLCAEKKREVGKKCLFTTGTGRNCTRFRHSVRNEPATGKPWGQTAAFASSMERSTVILLVSAKPFSSSLNAGVPTMRMLILACWQV